MKKSFNAAVEFYNISVINFGLQFLKILAIKINPMKSDDAVC
jgi:hypothetical protein